MVTCGETERANKKMAWWLACALIGCLMLLGFVAGAVWLEPVDWPQPGRWCGAFGGALITNDYDYARLLLKKHPELVDCEGDLEGCPLLCRAVWEGWGDVVRFLLEHGANPNIRQGQETPLHLAAENGALGYVKLLLEYGADPNLRDEQGMTPLGVAIEKGQTGIAEVLRAHGAKE